MSASAMMHDFPHDALATLGVQISRLVSDSRTINAGDTFVAYPGGRVDGRHFIGQAIERGANAVIWESEHFGWRADWKVPNLPLSNLRQRAGYLADTVYGSPSRKLWMVGVTGTNGKTTCSHWVANSLNSLGRKCALVGTLGNGFPTSLTPSANTTPEAIVLHGLLADLHAQGAKGVAMEVSSHALSQGRVNGVHFDVAVFTNLSRDHLDYHGDMERYAAAKRQLLAWPGLRYVVLNLDDTLGAVFAEQLQAQSVEVVGYGISDAALQLAERLGMRMVFGRLLQMSVVGMQLAIHSSWGAAELNSRQVGRFNAENLLATLATLLVSDVSLQAAVQVLGEQPAVAGRMDTLGGSGRPTVVVDYAHTPDALEKVLHTLREVTRASSGKLICVLGCGGDRDRGKRPLMGEVAAALADHVVITSDNPRSEDPYAIIDDILSGIKHGSYEVVTERAQAIAQAIGMAQADDTVLIAGKGHENYQEVKGVRYPFSDHAVAKTALVAWEANSAKQAEVAP